MKNLANCTPREFLAQTNRIRKAAERWLDLTGILEIRRRLPKLEAGDTEEERRSAVTAQIAENARAMLDAALDAHPDETAELLGLMCFIEPEELDAHPMSELLGALAELLNCREVADFFTSLARWESAPGSAPGRR